MLILITPDFEGTEAELKRLAQLTGLVVYDLKTKLKPGAWGVVRVLADAARARELEAELKNAGFPAVLVDSDVAFDPNRQIVPVSKLELEADQVNLQLGEQKMSVPLKSLLLLVRGVAQIRSERSTGSPSSGNNYRAVVPTAEDIQAFRESQTSASFTAYQVADLHFATVGWVARLDARKTEFSGLGRVAGSPAQILDQVADTLGQQAGVLVDRGARNSSLASFATRPMPIRRSSPAPGGPIAHRERPPADPRFDGYSRLVAQAERARLGLAEPTIAEVW